MDELQTTPEALESPHVINLVVPIDGVSSLTLREMNLTEIAKFRREATKFGEVDAMKNIIAQISGVDVATIGKIGTRDFMACSNYINGFFG